MADVEPPQLTRGQAVAVAAIVAALVAGILGAWWWYDARRADPAPDPSGPAASDRTGEDGDRRGTDEPPGGGDGAGDGAGDGDGGEAGPEEGDRELGDLAEQLAGQGRRVVVISVDGLGSSALGAGTPVLGRLLAEGAGTTNARTTYERTDTLPNHMSMVTGRPVDLSRGGHGVTWNEDTDDLVPAGVASVFDVVDAADGSSAVYAGKVKFDLWDQSWPLEEFVADGDAAALVDEVVADLQDEDRALTFLHLAGPDQTGHGTGWGSAAYRRAVRSADAAVGEVVDAVEDDRDLAREVVVIVTADHGGVAGAHDHSRVTARQNYTIPFVVWGADVADGDLYDLNPDYADPGGRRPAYDGPQPVRNADVANLVTDLLGLPPVPGSSINADQELDVLAR